MYAWTASRTSAERFPCDVFSFKNASISSRFSFSSRSVIRSFSSIQVPRPDRGNPYDEVIQHSARFLACCPPYPGPRYLYPLSIVIRRRTKGLHRPAKSAAVGDFDFYFVCQIEDAKILAADTQNRGVLRREKLYEKRSYLRAWRRRPARGVAGNRRLGPLARPQSGRPGLLRGRSRVLVENPSSQRDLDRAGDRPPVGLQSPHARSTRLTFGGSSRNGRRLGRRPACTSPRRTRLGRNGTRTGRIRAWRGISTSGSAPSSCRRRPRRTTRSSGGSSSI